MNYNDLLSKDLMKLMVGSMNAFYANILLNLKREFTDTIPTCAVSSTSIMINPDFYFAQSEPDRQFILLHEASHLVMYDLERMDGLNRDRANRAFDYYINNMLKEDGHTVPQMALYEDRFKGLEKMEIYKILEDEDPDNQGDKDFMHGDMEPLGGDGQGMSEEEMTMLDNLIQQAAVQAKACGGRVPAHIQEYLDSLYNPKLPWNRILEKYMDNFRKDDYSYSRFNKAFFPHGMILPTLYSEGMGRVGIALDESGSVSNSEYQLYLGAIKDILAKLEPEALDVVTFTTQINSVTELTSATEIDKVMVRGSGGTSLSPVFQHFNKHKPEVLIIFSDMECAPWTEKTSYDVINIVVGSSKSYKGIGKSIYVSN